MKTTMITMFDVNSIKSFDVFSFEVKGEPKGLGFVINGKPYMLWTHVYQNLEISQSHASKLIEKLNENSHYLSIPSAVMVELKSRYANLAFPKHTAAAYYLISAEGFNRVIMEVGTGSM